MNQVIFGNSLRDWAVAIGGGLLVWALLSLFRNRLVRRFEKTAARTTTVADDLFVEFIRSIRKSYVAGATLSIGLLSLALPHSARLGLQWLTAIVLVAQGVRSANRLIEFWLRHYASSHGEIDRTTLRALNYGLRGLTFIVVVIVALHNLGINVTALIAGASVGGIALALALQNILGDLFGALSIVLDKPFVVGDAIAVDNFEGEVVQIGLKSTRVRSVNGEEVEIGRAHV